MTSRLKVAILVLFSTLAQAACKKPPQIKNYRVPKEDISSQAAKFKRMAAMLEQKRRDEKN